MYIFNILWAYNLIPGGHLIEGLGEKMHRMK